MLKLCFAPGEECLVEIVFHCFLKLVIRARNLEMRSLLLSWHTVPVEPLWPHSLVLDIHELSRPAHNAL